MFPEIPVSSPTPKFPQISLQKTGSSNFRPFAVCGIFLGPGQATDKGLDGTGVSPRFDKINQKSGVKKRTFHMEKRLKLIPSLKLTDCSTYEMDGSKMRCPYLGGSNFSLGIYVSFREGI